MTLKEIERKYKVNIVFKKTKFEAFYSHRHNTITISSKYNMLDDYNKLIPIIFHELGHKHCFINDLFIAYHRNLDRRLIFLTGLRAERFVDKWAAKEMLLNGFDIEYPYFYSGKQMQKNFTKYLNETF